MARVIRDECLGSGRITVSSAEAVRGWTHCSACGRVLKIRVTRDLEATLPRHRRQEAK